VKLLDHGDLRALGLRWSRRWLRALVRQGKFPQPVMLLGRVAWREDEVTAWVDALPRATGRVPAVSAPIAKIVPLRRRIRRRRSANRTAAEAEARFRAVCELMA
jgi:predicted DNA-binding transcriptional regulator AlpA